MIYGLSEAAQSSLAGSDYVNDASEETHSASRAGDLLRQLREAEGLSFGKLAKKAGVAKSTVLRAEQGHYVPTTEVLIRLCNALDVSYGDLAELVGFDAAKSLPEPAVYFRTKYGLPPAATVHLEQEFARVARAYGIDPDQAGPGEGEDE